MIEVFIPQRQIFNGRVQTRSTGSVKVQRLREEREAEFGPEHEGWLAELGEAHKRIRAEVVESADQKAALHEFASEESFQEFLKRRNK